MWSTKRGAEEDPRARSGRVVAAVAVCVSLAAIPAGAAEPERVTRGVGDTQPNGRSELPATNGDGSVVVFKSLASNLIANDGNARIDVFAYDRTSDAIERIPRRPDTGTDPLEESYPPVVSDDGRYVAFGSAARNLVRGDFNLFPDAYRYDRASEDMLNLSLIEDINEEGRLGGRVPDLPPSISADGSLVAFTSASPHLAGVDTNETHDVFVYDAVTDELELISIADFGSPSSRAGNDLSGAGSISPDGNFVAFCSEASNLTADSPRDSGGIFLRDRAAGVTTRVAPVRSGRCLQREMFPAVSTGGEVVAFVTDLPLASIDDNGDFDVYVWRAAGRTIELVSVGTDGRSGNGPSRFVALGGDGRLVAFQSAATSLVDAPDSNGSGTDVFAVDLADGRVLRLTGNGDELAPGDSLAPAISRDGTVVVFQSDARLTADDTNSFPDIYAIVNELSFTPTPTETATDTPTPSPTATPTATPTGTNTPAPSPSHTSAPQATPTATATGTSNGGGSPTATPTVTGPTGPTSTPVTRTPIILGANDDGCGCRIDPVTGKSASQLPLVSLIPPLLALLLRRRRLVEDQGRS